MRRIVATLLAGFALLLAAPAVAAAQGSADSVYDGQGAVNLVRAGGGDGGGPSDLPSTGLQVALAAIAGAGLLGTGLAVRRANRSRGV